jgi:methylated-DNA-protein-cysteine methyltransferase-like protein
VGEPIRTLAGAVVRLARAQVRARRRIGHDMIELQPQSFVSRVYRLVRAIPRGRVATYGQIAAWLDRPAAARAVGWAMKRCPPGVPWHRVVNASGGISRRPNTGSMLTQRLLLEQEGVPVRRGRVSLAGSRWDGPARRTPTATRSPAPSGEIVRV